MNFYSKITTKGKRELFCIICDLFPSIVSNNAPYVGTVGAGRTINLGDLGLLLQTLKFECVSDLESEKIIRYVNENFFHKRELLLECGCSEYKMDKNKTLALNIFNIFWNSYVSSLIKTNS